jgi:multidrug efflux pump
MRRSLGTAVISCMVGVTLFGIFLTPVFYSLLTWFGDVKTPAPGAQHPSVDGQGKTETAAVVPAKVPT